MTRRFFVHKDDSSRKQEIRGPVGSTGEVVSRLRKQGTVAPDEFEPPR